MHICVVLSVILCAVFPALSAPTAKRDAVSQLKEQMENFQSHMADLNNQFKTVLETVKKESGSGRSNVLDKRVVETSNEATEKHKEKEMRKKLKQIDGQLRILRIKVHNMKEYLNNEYDDEDDEDDDDLDFDRRELKISKSEENPKCIERSIVQEKDPLILKISTVMMKHIHPDSSREFIESLVNRTADLVAAKTKATHGIKDFRKRLLNAVLQLLKLRSILVIQTEGKFIDKLDDRQTRTFKAAGKDVDQSKVVKALEELLEGPLVKGFVSKEEERKMIENAVKVLGKVFGLSENRTESVIKTMIKHIEGDVKTRGKVESKEKNKPITDDEKIKGLQKMIEDKVKENKLNIKEMKFLVKGLASAVAARNKLSAEKTKKIEDRISKGAEDFFSKVKIPDEKLKKDQSPKNTFNTFEDIPTGFKTAQSSSKVEHAPRFVKGSISSKRTLMDQLKELEKLTTQFDHSSPTTSKDDGDAGGHVTIEAAKNTRGSTRIVERYNGKRNEIDIPKTTETEQDDDSFEDLESLVDNLQDIGAMIKDKVASFRQKPNFQNKKFESLTLDAAKGTMGHRKINAGFKRKRGLFDIVSGAIALIKSLHKQLKKSNKRKEVERIITATPETRTKMSETEKQSAEKIPTTQTTMEPTKVWSREDNRTKSKKSEISDIMEAEIKRAEAEIQKELEKKQKEKDNKMSATEGEKEKEEQEKEEQKKKEQNEKEKKQQREEAAKEREQEEKEKQQEKDENKAEKEKQLEEKEQQKEEEMKAKVQQAQAKKQEKAEQQRVRNKEITEKEIQKEEGKKKGEKEEENQQKQKVSEAQIEADKKENEKFSQAQANGKSHLQDELQSSQERKEKEETPETNSEDSDEVMKELDELFAKN